MFITKPMEIENRSMEIIAPHLAGLTLNDDERKIYSRMIHASGDVGYAPIIKIHPKAVEATKAALNRGANIFTDVEMVRRGISLRTLKKFGGEIFCKVSDDDVRELAKAEGITRSMRLSRLAMPRLRCLKSCGSCAKKISALL